MRRILTLAIALTPALLVAQQDFSKVDIKVVKVAGSVYALTGSGGNIVCWLATMASIVDDEFARSRRRSSLR